MVTDIAPLKGEVSIEFKAQEGTVAHIDKTLNDIGHVIRFGDIAPDIISSLPCKPDVASSNINPGACRSGKFSRSDIDVHALQKISGADCISACMSTATSQAIHAKRFPVLLPKVIFFEPIACSSELIFE